MAGMKKEVPEEIRELEGCTDFDKFVEVTGITGIRHWINGAKDYAIANGSEMKRASAFIRKPLVLNDAFFSIRYGNGMYLYSGKLIYIGSDLQPWQTDASIALDVQNRGISMWVKEISVGKWKPFRKLEKHFITFQTEDEVNGLIRANNPYTWAYLSFKGVNPFIYCMSPQLEQLMKMDMKFAYNVVSSHFYDRNRLSISQTEVSIFNRLTQPGRNPKEIFKCSKAVYTALKNEKSLRKWDAIRKMEKFGRITSDAICNILDAGLNEKDVENMSNILRRTYKGTPVFTFETLTNYLERIDMFEAIGKREGLELLSDYLNCCEFLGVKPKTDGDSLKREHDVMARNARLHRDEILAKKMEPRCETMKKYDYSESVFFIRGIRSFDDLLDEANQQHNCLAGYAQKIASGNTMIFALRETAHPEKSLVSVQLSPASLKIQQKYIAFNKPVRNKAVTDFLKRWECHVREIGKPEKQKKAV